MPDSRSMPFFTRGPPARAGPQQSLVPCCRASTLMRCRHRHRHRRCCHHVTGTKGMTTCRERVPETSSATARLFRHGLPRVKHHGLLVCFFVVIEQPTVGGLVIGRGHPVSRNDARQSDADVGRSVQPGRGRFGGQAATERAREMVAVSVQQVVAGSEELVGYLRVEVQYLVVNDQLLRIM